jgi:uncharacterized membrane protein SpoIIM required for sporulation
LRYDRFVAARRAAWDRLEAGLDAARRGRDLDYDDLEALATAYRQVLQDHAWARSRYPRTAAARRLERLALAGTAWLEPAASEERRSISGFFIHRFPLAVRRQLPLSFLAGALFLATVLLGLGLALREPGLAVTLLGPQTLQELAEGRLWTEALTTTVPPAYSSSAIATNNMSVALTTWAGGALGGLGTAWVVVLNGWLLGAILGITLRYSMAAELLDFVAAHGPLEITLVLVASGAGLAIGRALLVAEDRPRSEALGEAARESLVVVLGCLPWFVVLGIVEALLSPNPLLGWPAKLAVGTALLAGFVALVVFGGPRPQAPDWRAP